eukprot:648633-Rhodomonas_salina.2
MSLSLPLRHALHASAPAQHALSFSASAPRSLLRGRVWGAGASGVAQGGRELARYGSSRGAAVGKGPERTGPSDGRRRSVVVWGRAGRGHPECACGVQCAVLRSAWVCVVCGTETDLLGRRSESKSAGEKREAAESLWVAPPILLRRARYSHSL